MNEGYICVKIEEGEMPFVGIRDGIKLRFEVLAGGRSTDPQLLNVIVTLGGHTGCDAARGLAETIVQRIPFARVLTWDRRNSHQSGIKYSPNTPLVLEDVEDMHALLEAIKFPPAVLVGSSSGARLSAMFAVRYPNKCQGLVLAPPTGGDAALLLSHLYYENPMEVVREKGMEAVLLLDEFSGLCNESAVTLKTILKPEDFIRSLEVSSQWIKRFQTSTFIGIQDEDLVKLTTIPALVVHDGNAEDKYHSIATALKLVIRLGLPQVYIIPGILQQTRSSNERLSELIQMYFSPRNHHRL